MSGAPCRVLVVDDNPDICANISDILGDLGYEATTAADSEAALRYVEDRAFDVAVLDYKLPGMDGAALYKAMKKIRPALPAIMVTAYAGTDGARKAMDAGTVAVLGKPVDVRRLLKLIEEIS